MNDDKIYTWEEFKLEAAAFRRMAPPTSPALFRGQANSEWDLETTLERSGHDESVEQYYRLIFRVKTEIEVATQTEWSNDPSVFDLIESTREYDGFSRALANLPHYAYMAYLRHHGFPSPLLDWSKSPFVAAYFAFRADIDSEQNVAIFAYTDSISSFKVSSSDKPQIHRLGPYIAAHKRHFSQQSEYTTCVRFFSDRGWSFYPHSSVFETNPKSSSQDVLKKFVLSATERVKVLRELHDYNLNAYSLFGSEEALMESLSNREEIRLEP